MKFKIFGWTLTAERTTVLSEVDREKGAILRLSKVGLISKIEAIKRVYYLTGGAMGPGLKAAKNFIEEVEP